MGKTGNLRESRQANSTEDARVYLAAWLNNLIHGSEMTQRVAAQLIGMPQPKVSALNNMQLHGISLERLITALVVLDQSVTITVQARGRGAALAVSLVAPRAKEQQ
jgi:predicted XRE-type DNA-binding protein